MNMQVVRARLGLDLRLFPPSSFAFSSALSGLSHISQIQGTFFACKN